MFLWKALWLFQLFSSDVWMIKITIKTNQIVRLDVCFFQKQITYKDRLSPKVQLFPLVYWFVNVTLADKHDTKNV